MCYETFKAKPPKAAGEGGVPAAFAEVSSGVEGFTITGLLVIGDNGIHLFIMSIERHQEGRAGTRIGDQVGGVLGFVVGAAINAAVDSSTEAPIHRPPKLILKPTGLVLGNCEKILGDAPNIVKCKEFHTIEKRDLQSVSFGFLGGMTLKTQYLEFEVGGVGPEEKAAAYLKLKGYPFKD